MRPDCCRHAYTGCRDRAGRQSGWGRSAVVFLCVCCRICRRNAVGTRPVPAGRGSNLRSFSCREGPVRGRCFFLLPALVAAGLSFCPGGVGCGLGCGLLPAPCRCCFCTPSGAPERGSDLRPFPCRDAACSLSVLLLPSIRAPGRGSDLRSVPCRDAACSRPVLFPPSRPVPAGLFLPRVVGCGLGCGLLPAPCRCCFCPPSGAPDEARICGPSPVGMRPACWRQ